AVDALRLLLAARVGAGRAAVEREEVGGAAGRGRGAEAAAIGRLHRAPAVPLDDLDAAGVRGPDLERLELSAFVGGHQVLLASRATGKPASRVAASTRPPRSSAPLSSSRQAPGGRSIAVSAQPPP